MCGARGGGAHGLLDPIGERPDIGKLGRSSKLGIFGYVCPAKQQHVRQCCDEQHFG